MIGAWRIDCHAPDLRPLCFGGSDPQAEET
jgi:hypothetical protein